MGWCCRCDWDCKPDNLHDCSRVQYCRIRHCTGSDERNYREEPSRSGFEAWNRTCGGACRLRERRHMQLLQLRRRVLNQRESLVPSCVEQAGRERRGFRGGMLDARCLMDERYRCDGSWQESSEG